jgi:rare lipoprotein A
MTALPRKGRFRTLAAALLLSLVPGFALAAAAETGIASFYGKNDGFHGGPTASGERYDRYSMTAAHKTLPFNTRVRVTNLRNGKSVVVRINNRGPYTRGRVIDLSVAAARELGFYDRGLTQVRVDVVEMGNGLRVGQRPRNASTAVAARATPVSLASTSVPDVSPPQARPIPTFRAASGDPLDLSRFLMLGR